jgi:hypothetical protein
VARPALEARRVVGAEPAEVHEIGGEAALGLEHLDAGVDLRRPGRGRPGRADPAVAASLGRAAERRHLLGGARVVGGDAFGRQPVEDAGVALAHEPHRGRVALPQPALAPHPPVGDGAERVVGRVPDARGPRVRLVVHRLDEPRAGAVAGFDHGDDELAVGGRSVDREHVSLVQAEAGADDRVRVALELLGLEHALRGWTWGRGGGHGLTVP